MLKKTISYTDYDGNQRTEDFYFNLSKAEITEMELSMEGGMRAYIKRIIAAKSQLELVKLFKDVVLKSYGKKSADGRLFMKNDTIRAEFEGTSGLQHDLHGSGDERGQSKRLCERHYARRHAEAEPGYGDGRSRKRCARTERGIGTGLISSDIFPLWRREAAPGNFRAAFIFLLLQALTRQLPLGGSLLKEHI